MDDGVASRHSGGQGSEIVQIAATDMRAFRGHLARGIERTCECDAFGDPIFFGALAESAGFYSDKRGYFILRVGAIYGLHFSLINPRNDPRYGTNERC